jgi:hypothetical protein
MRQEIGGGWWVEWRNNDQYGDVCRMVPGVVGRVWRGPARKWRASHLDSGVMAGCAFTHQAMAEFYHPFATADEAVAWVQAQDVAWRGR